MPKITYKRVERDCTHNRMVRAGHTSLYSSSRIIYDQEVYEDGEHIATFCKRSGKGYFLRDIGGDLVKRVRHNGVGSIVKAQAQADFDFLIERNRQFIPTREEVEERAAAKVKAEDEAFERNVVAAKSKVVELRSDEMFELLKKSAKVDPLLKEMQDVLSEVDQLLALIEKEMQEVETRMRERREEG